MIPELTKYPRKPDEFKTVKQQTSTDCTVAVAAMATGLSLKEAKAGMKITVLDGYAFYKMREVACFLASHGILMGMHVGVGEGHLPRTIEFSWRMADFPAILVVVSERFKEQDHCVLWDGKQIRDPNPVAPDKRDLEEFKVLEIYPLPLIEEDWCDEITT